MARLRKAAIIVAILAAILAGAGYITAKMSQPSIEQEIRRYVLAKNITGREFGGGKVTPEQIKVTSWVKSPFVVVGSYSVPFDMHASYHRTTYLVMPWGRYVLSKESVYTV
jgi:hypothetical protein